MARSTVTSKGQITIPKAIRDRLGLTAGDTLEFTVDEKGRIVVRSNAAENGVLGVLRDFAPQHPLSIEEMRDAVRERVAGADRARKSRKRDG